jgi:hypothetical protein
MGSYCFALRYYSVEPYRKLVASIVDNVAVFLVIIVDLRYLRG